MNEQLYAQSTYRATQHEQINGIEELAVTFDHMLEKIHNAYESFINSLADSVIKRFNL